MKVTKYKWLAAGALFYLMQPNVYGQQKQDDSIRESKKIDEVIIVGYARQTKASVTSSFSRVSDKELMDVNVPDVSTMLQGKATGVQIMPGGGQPGTPATVQVRGTSTVNGPTQALWVVDGVIMDNVPNIDPSQIESINILKDAASTALYGSRGANGVVQVTTKNGKAGVGLLSLTATQSFNTFTNGRFRLMDGIQFYDWFNDLENHPTVPADLRAKGYDWLKEGTTTGHVNNYTLSYNGGSEKSKTYISGNYYRESGTVKNYDYDRFSFRLNHEEKVRSWLILRPKLSAAYTKTMDRQGSLYDMYLDLPWDHPRDAAGNLINPRDFDGTWWGRDQSNYLYDLQWNYGRGKQLDLLGNMDAEIKLTSYLTFFSTNSLTYRTNDYLSYTDPRSISGEATNGALSQTHSKSTNEFFNQMLRFNKKFGDHQLTGLAAYEFSAQSFETSNAQVFNIAPGAEVFDSGASSGLKPSGSKSQRVYSAALFNAEYAFQNKYFVQGSLRRESSSAFGSKNRTGNFYAYSLGWDISKEAFFNVKQIDNWKLRASRGKVGNTPSPNYGWQDLYALTQTYNGTIAAVWSQLGNPGLSWESVIQNDLGMDIRAFNNRLSFTLDYFHNKTNNLLVLLTLPAVTGVDIQYQNIGDIRNDGWEFNLNYDLIRNENLKWNIGGNLSAYKNRVLSTRDNEIQLLSNSKAAVPGQDVNSFYMRKWMGVNSQTGAGQWEIVNADGSRAVTSDYNKATLQLVGASTPDYYGAVTTSVTYKNLYLNANLYFSQGGKVYNSMRELFDADGAYPTYNQMILMPGWSRWEKPGDQATHPQLIYNNTSLTNKPSSRYLENDSYVKLRSVQIGYNFPTSLTERLSLSNASVYLMGENLFTITRFSGVDPEVGPSSGQSQYSGFAGQIYPLPRRFTLGLNLSF